MKKLPFAKVSSVLSLIVDLILLLEFIGLATFLIILFQSQSFNLNFPAEKLMFFSISQNLIFILFAIFITILLRQLINSFKKESFFEPANARIIRNISILILCYVFLDSIVSQFNPILDQRANYISDLLHIESVKIAMFIQMISAINFKMLFVAAVTFVISIAFQKGNELKEQATLTI